MRSIAPLARHFMNGQLDEWQHRGRMVDAVGLCDEADTLSNVLRCFKGISDPPFDANLARRRDVTP